MLTLLHPQPLRRGLALAMVATVAATPVAHAALTANADGTVTDSTTGLVWDQCAYGFTGATCGGGSAFSGDWPSALAQASAANTAAYKGFSDWRVPNKNELESIVKLDVYDPAIDATVFPNTPLSEYFVTSTTSAGNPAAASVVEFSMGSSGVNDKANGYFVRLVRSGQPSASYDSLPQVVNGSCGSAHAVSPLTASAPSGAALCSAGTAGSVTAGNGAYTWSCAGSNGGSTASCSASRGYTVTPSAGANGSISPSTPQVVAYNATPTFTVTANSGYTVDTVSGCGGALSGGTYTTGAVTAGCVVSTSFASVAAPPPPAPAPEPSPTPPVVEQGGNPALSGGPYDVRANAVNGAVLTATGPTQLQLANGGGLLRVQPEPTGTTARLAFVAGPNGEPVPRLLGGRARITATTPGQPLLGWLQSLLPAANTVVLNAGVCSGTPSEVLVEVNADTGQTLITVLGCQVALPAALAQPPAAVQARAAAAVATPITKAIAVPAILPGEYVVLNAQGQAEEMGLGSAAGDQGLTGDNVARTATPGLVWLHTRPVLNGSSVRLGANVAQAVVDWLTAHQQFTEFVNGGPNGLLQAKQGGKRVVLGALGRVSIDPGSTQPDGWQPQGQAAFALNLGGLGMTWAPALADPDGFARLLAVQGGSTVVQADGTLLVTLGSGVSKTHIAVQAGEQLEIPNNLDGFGQTVEGVLTYTNRVFGSPQALHPTAADFAGLRAAVLAADPAGSVIGLGQGRIKLVLGGQTYTLKPDMVLVALPAQHVGKTVWLEGQPVRLFMPVASLPGFAQGFGVE